MEFKEAEITTLKNMVEHDPGSGANPAKVNEKIYEKSTVSTAAASMAELMFADSSITRMGANTRFSFQSKERLVKLEQGTVLIHTPPGNGGATVDCGGVTAAVSGTTFMASRDASGNAMFVLLEGQGGLTVTVGKSTAVIRPGQAASVGAETVKEVATAPTADKSSPAPAAGSATPGGDEKGPGQAPGAAPAAGGGDTGGAPPPAPAAAPKIQVFDIDVKRVVTTSPLVVDFKAELPSASKIEKTVETQQQAVKEGKLEKLEVEVVAVKSADGDLLVGAPKVEREESVVVNKKVDLVGQANGGGDNLDIETAAGPGASSGPGGGVAATPAPRVEAPAPPPVVTPPVNPGQTAIQPPPPPAQVAVAARVNDVSRPFNQENPNFGFSITSGSLLTGHSLVTDFLTSAVRTSGVSGSPYSVNFSNPRIVDSSGTDVSSRYNLTTSAGFLNVLKASQSVDFDSVGSLTFGQEANLVAQALAGDVRYEVVSGPGSVVNGKLVANSGTGNVVVRAVTAGNDNYSGADAEQTITLGKAGQSVDFTLPSGLTYDTTASLGATVTGAGSVTYELVNAADSSKVSINGGVLRALSGTGSVQVRAVTAGDNNYDVASAIQTITLGKAAQNLRFDPTFSVPTGTSRSMPVLGVQTGSPIYSILDTDGRASVDSAGNVTVGKILEAKSFTVRAAAAGDNNFLFAQKDFSVGINRNVKAIEAANPVRQLLDLPPSPELEALDEFFYFTGKAAGYNGGPDRFFTDAGVGDTDRILANSGVSAQLYPAQTWDFFAARKFMADPGVLHLAPSVGKSELTYFGNTVDLGSANPVWQGTVNPRTASTSLGFRYLTLNLDYLPVFDKTLAGTEPIGFFDSFGSFFSPLENFPVWDDAGGSINSANQVQINLMGSRVLTLVAGSGGITGRGLEIDANGGGVQMLTSGELNLKTTRVIDVGSEASGAGLTLEAKGKVKLGTDGGLDLDVPTNAGLPEQQQVRLEARTDSSGNPFNGNLAVVRTGDSLELRNVTVRGFAETRLEKLNPTTKALEGRVLISGSSVRDFKIKELVGAAVNADAKIQMMALDQNGALAGDMKVEGKMPVEAKLASALAAAGETLPTGMAGRMVDAKQIDLAARNLKFENANLVAMNAITARANTILIQNSFMTVVRNQGMINMYVESGLVNTTYGNQVAGRVNFDGVNRFQIGSNYFEIGNQAQLSAAYGTNLIDLTQNGGNPQAGKVNVLKL